MHSLITWLMMWWAFLGLGQPGLAAHHHHHGHHQQRVITQPSPSPTAPETVAPTPSTTPTPTGTPEPTPKPTPTPSPSPITAAPDEIASEQTCPGQSDAAKSVQALSCLTSNARKFHGLSTMSNSPALVAAAAAKDLDMAKCGYGHTACGNPFDFQIKAKGYTGKCYGENIAMGQHSPREVFVAWMNSPGHRANILNAQYRDLGVAETSGSQGPLWTMELGGC